MGCRRSRFRGRRRCPPPSRVPCHRQPRPPVAARSTIARGHPGLARRTPPSVGTRPCRLVAACPRRPSLAGTHHRRPAHRGRPAARHPLPASRRPLDRTRPQRPGDPGRDRSGGGAQHGRRTARLPRCRVLLRYADSTPHRLELPRGQPGMVEPPRARRAYRDSRHEPSRPCSRTLSRPGRTRGRGCGPDRRAPWLGGREAHGTLHPGPGHAAARDRTDARNRPARLGPRAEPDRPLPHPGVGHHSVAPRSRPGTPSAWISVARASSS